VQIHPTGFLDPSDLSAPAKTLCGEMMRGVGGVLLTPDGRRFVNELLARDQVGLS
jgi:aspartate oxidase